METAEEYYNDPALYGHYQFTTLKDIVDEMVTVSRLDTDSYLKNTNRALIILHAKIGVQKLTKDTSASILDIEMTVGEDSFIVLPQDFVKCVSVSLVIVDDKGKRYLKPLDENNDINTATGYLQDDQAKILFDDEGAILTADASNAYNIPYRSIDLKDTDCDGDKAFTDTAALTKYGEFKVDTENGCLILSDNVVDKEIVLSYLSDGLQLEHISESKIRVHKYIEEAVKAWAYFGCIEKRQTVPQNTKTDAKLAYRTLKFKAIKDLAGLDLNKIVRAMRSKSKYL